MPSAGQRHSGHAGVSIPCSLEEVIAAYKDCQRNKRSSASAIAFELEQEPNLIALYEDLQEGTYRPGRSICFVIRHPKPREVWAAPYRDRIVHHLLYNHIRERFERSFIADSCACIPGRGTLYAAHRLEAKARSITKNWTREARYLKCDLANFFVSIHKPTLRELLANKIDEPWWMAIAETVLFHDPRQSVVLQSEPDVMALIPPHKSLFNQPAHRGLPIGNLSSQFFANIYLNELDQFVKHRLRARHYIRYVDDFVLLHESAQRLNDAHDAIREWLPPNLGVRLNDSKTIRQPIHRGIDFVGQVVAPHRRTIRRRTVNNAMHRLAHMPAADLYQSANSYFGLLRQASHSHRDRQRLAEIVMLRGHSVNYKMTKTYRKTDEYQR